MERRQFLKNALAGGLALATADSAIGLPAVQSESLSTAVPGQKDLARTSKIRGVNLGAWLVLEKWMVPSVFEGTSAGDEYSLCLALGSQAKALMERHRDTFITAEDFRWMKNCGLNAVRLPVGYWALEAPKPYLECSRQIQFALDQAQQNGLKLLLDLHGAPGSQNGWDHSGRSGPINWHKDPKNIEETLRALESFAEAYGKHPALLGIELLNEPGRTVPLAVLQQFYLDAYGRLRRHLAANVAIVFHDAFRPLAWKNFMREPAFGNVIVDTHLYQCFTKQDKGRSAREQLQFAINRKGELDEMQREELPTIVGEWSLNWPWNSKSGLSSLQTSAAIRAYGDTQLLNYEGTDGWFFWSYKLERADEWNFRHCVEREYLPGSFSV
jgi:glucan 1,3-beta-glucosidase